MTEELAQAIVEQPYNAQCYKQIQALYADYTITDIVQAIARYRAHETLKSVVKIQQ